MRAEIKIEDDVFEVELNSTETAEEIYNALPIKAKGKTWGKEIYFDAPVNRNNENPTEEVAAGDLAYWPEGPALALFFGKTPVSTNGEPRPASPVTVVGKVSAKSDLDVLHNIKDPVSVEVSKVD